LKACGLGLPLGALAGDQRQLRAGVEQHARVLGQADYSVAVCVGPVCVARRLEWWRLKAARRGVVLSVFWCAMLMVRHGVVVTTK